LANSATLAKGPGVALLSAGSVSQVWGLVRSGSIGWGSPEVLGTITGGVLLLAGFVGWEAVAVSPMVPLRPFRRRSFAFGSATQFLMSAWIAHRAGSGLSYGELAVSLLLAGIGISMALPTAPTAVPSAVDRVELGTASGVTMTMQRFGAVFATATAIFSESGGLPTMSDGNHFLLPRSTTVPAAIDPDVAEPALHDRVFAVGVRASSGSWGQ
jgi:hypothetical protein